ncbi:MAG TPA: hypothetical protein VHA80_05905 [Solirubrobacterales bacterium]|nr:hypothetical protein [Solirubrobacterales bacterium]
MREKLNESKAAQIGLVAVLVVVAAVLFLKSSGGGESEGTEAEPETKVTIESGGKAVSISAPTPTASASGMGELPTSLPTAKPPPRKFTAAYDSGEPVALLIVHDGGIDDAWTRLALREVARVEPVAAFVVPAKRIADYASVTVGLDIAQVPALIVLRPKGLSHGTPQASVLYGYQTPESVYLAVRDAVYTGPERSTYHPG